MLDTLFAPGIATLTISIFVIEALSLLLMIIVLLAFKRVQRKKKELFLTLHDGEIHFPRHRILVCLYIFMTFGIGVISIYLYIVQPHIL